MAQNESGFIIVAPTKQQTYAVFEWAIPDIVCNLDIAELLSYSDSRALFYTALSEAQLREALLEWLTLETRPQYALSRIIEQDYGNVFHPRLTLQERDRLSLLGIHTITYTPMPSVAVSGLFQYGLPNHRSITSLITEATIICAIKRVVAYVSEQMWLLQSDVVCAVMRELLISTLAPYQPMWTFNSAIVNYHQGAVTATVAVTSGIDKYVFTIKWDTFLQEINQLVEQNGTRVPPVYNFFHQQPELYSVLTPSMS